MTEELQGALTEILNGALTAKDFMVSELPEVVTQLLLWKGVMSGIGFSFGLLLIIIGSTVFSKTFIPALKKYNADSRRNYEKDDSFFFWGLTLIPVFIGFLMMTHNMDWIQIWLAPKVYLIEYAASLAK